jgi:predicted 3-demethylubiquinone-9 3-methyltransferase (glyoxalase superfamily)
MPAIKKIASCLWFNGQAEDAANFYVSVFDSSSIHRTARFTDEGFETGHRTVAARV